MQKSVHSEKWPSSSRLAAVCPLCFETENSKMQTYNSQDAPFYLEALGIPQDFYINVVHSGLH